MPKNRRNPFSMSYMLESLGNAVQSKSLHGRQDSLSDKLAGLGIEVPIVDVEIRFIGASGLPNMDLAGGVDPYFMAKIDDKISYVSNVKADANAPVWNEVWRVRNVPSTASLQVEVYDKDEGSASDDLIGRFSLDIESRLQEVDIEGPLLSIRKSRGKFWVKIDKKPSETPKCHPDFYYIFDGPIRFTRHFSPTVGLLASSSRPEPSDPNSPDAHIYSTWKFYMRGVSLFFQDVHQPWNKNYAAAQKIFSGSTSAAVKGGIQAAHKLLYARLSSNGGGVLDRDGHEDAISLAEVLDAGNPNALGGGQRIKPVVYTYVISSVDDTFRFSETGAAFFVDFASKHALHANCHETVRYSGEFHPRPVGGWANFDDSLSDDDVEWELVVDNNSGTYAPDKNLLPTVQECLEYNFNCGRLGPKKGFSVVVYDRDDPLLTESREGCRAYAAKMRDAKPVED